MFHPALRKTRVRRSVWRGVGNTSELFRDAAAPNRVVARQLIETTVDANILNRHQAVGATNIERLTHRCLEDRARVDVSSRVHASVDRLLENRVRGGIPTVLEVSMAGVSYGVASSQDEGAVVVFKIASPGDLLDEDGHKADGMGCRAGASFMGANRVRDMVLEVGACRILAIPACWEHDLDANPIGTVLFGEFERLWTVTAEAMVVECLVRGIRALLGPSR